jgi:hypothetical protein
MNRFRTPLASNIESLPRPAWRARCLSFGNYVCFTLYFDVEDHDRASLIDDCRRSLDRQKPDFSDTQPRFHVAPWPSPNTIDELPHVPAQKFPVGPATSRDECGTERAAAADLFRWAAGRW